MCFSHFLKRQSTLLNERYWNYKIYLHRQLAIINQGRLPENRRFLRTNVSTIECMVFESEYNQKHLVDGFVGVRTIEGKGTDEKYILIVRRGGYVYCIEYKNIDLNKASKIKEFMLAKIDETHKKIMDETVS